MTENRHFINTCRFKYPFARENLEQVGFWSVLLFSLCIFLGKAPTNISGALLFLVWTTHIFRARQNILTMHPYLRLFLFPVGAGLILAFFSAAGPMGTLAYLNQFKFMILPLPLATFIRHPRQLNHTLAMILLSAFISISYGLITTDGNLFGFFHGFQKIGRCADTLMIVNISIMVFLFIDKKNRPHVPLTVKILLATLFIVFFWAMGMTGIRGAWMGFCISIVLFLVFYRTRWIPLLLICLLLFFPLLKLVDNGLHFQIKTELYSIFKVFTPPSREEKRLPESLAGQTGPTNPLPYESNGIRRHIMKAGWDFAQTVFLTGTGVDNTAAHFHHFFSGKSAEYQKQFHFAKEHPKDFHNSYLQLLIETGIISTLIFMLFLTRIILKLFMGVKQSSGPEKAYILAALLSAVSFLASQFFHSDLFSYGGNLFFIALFTGFFHMEQYHAKQNAPANAIR